MIVLLLSLGTNALKMAATYRKVVHHMYNEISCGFDELFSIPTKLTSSATMPM